jgi:hypothetical protein
MSVDLTQLLDMDELSLEDIDAITSTGRDKGVYKQDLIDFLSSGKLGKKYQFQGKKANSVKTGFDTAVEAISKDADLSADLKAAAAKLVVKVRKVPVPVLDDEGNQTKDAEGNDVTEEQEVVFLINQHLVNKARGVEQAPAASEANGEAPAATEDATV